MTPAESIGLEPFRREYQEGCPAVVRRPGGPSCRRRQVPTRRGPRIDMIGNNSDDRDADIQRNIRSVVFFIKFIVLVYSFVWECKCFRITSLLRGG